MKPPEESSLVCVAAQTPVSASATIDAIFHHAFVADQDWYFDLTDKERLTSPEWPAAVRVIVDDRSTFRRLCAALPASSGIPALDGRHVCRCRAPVVLPRDKMLLGLRNVNSSLEEGAL